MSQPEHWRSALDPIIKQAAEQKRLDGMVIRVPEYANDPVEHVEYQGVKLQPTARIKSYDLVEVEWEKVPTGK